MWVRKRISLCSSGVDILEEYTLRLFTSSTPSVRFDGVIRIAFLYTCNCCRLLAHQLPWLRAGSESQITETQVEEISVCFTSSDFFGTRQSHVYKTF